MQTWDFFQFLFALENNDLIVLQFDITRSFRKECKHQIHLNYCGHNTCFTGTSEDCQSPEIYSGSTEFSNADKMAFSHRRWHVLFSVLSSAHWFRIQSNTQSRSVIKILRKAPFFIAGRAGGQGTCARCIFSGRWMWKMYKNKDTASGKVTGMKWSLTVSVLRSKAWPFSAGWWEMKSLTHICVLLQCKVKFLPYVFCSICNDFQTFTKGLHLQRKYVHKKRKSNQFVLGPCEKGFATIKAFKHEKKIFCKSVLHSWKRVVCLLKTYFCQFVCTSLTIRLQIVTQINLNGTFLCVLQEIVVSKRWAFILLSVYHGVMRQTLSGLWSTEL